MNDPCGNWIAKLNEARSEIERLSCENSALRRIVDLVESNGESDPYYHMTEAAREIAKLPEREPK